MDEQPVTGGPGPEGSEDGEMGFLGRAIRVYTDPERAFEAVDRHPETWWQPLVLLAILGGLAVYLVFDQVIQPEQLAALERRFEGEELARARQAIEGGLVRNMAYASGVIAPAVSAIVSALVAHLVAAYLMSGTGSFVRSLAVVSHALLVGVVESVVKVGMVLSLSTSQVHFGPALLLERPESPTFLYSLLAQIDLFTLWKIWLSAVGLAIVHRVGRQGLLWALLGVWAVWVIGSSAVGAALSG